MILDRLENAAMYGPLSPEILTALDYLRKTNFSKIENGRYELQGDRVFAIVSRYKQRRRSEIVWEAHRKYTDVQFIAEGFEYMGYTTLSDKLKVTQPYTTEKECVLFDPKSAKGDFFRVDAGGFTIFAPHDVHAPGLAPEGAEAVADVLKVVVKCLGVFKIP